MMIRLVAATGGDGESFGILGRIYKDRFSQLVQHADLKRAIDSYRSGFEKQPTDYYPAINLIQLLSLPTVMRSSANSRNLSHAYAS